MLLVWFLTLGQKYITWSKRGLPGQLNAPQHKLREGPRLQLIATEPFTISFKQSKEVGTQGACVMSSTSLLQRIMMREEPLLKLFCKNLNSTSNSNSTPLDVFRKDSFW